MIGATICNTASAQLVIDNAQFIIQPGATVTVQGDVTSNTDILGTGILQMNGIASQNINMNGFAIPNLEIKNPANVFLTGIASVTGDLLLTTGQILLGSNNLRIGNVGTITNATSTNFIVTNGTGKLIKAALSTTGFTFPIGNSASTYTPIAISNNGTADSIGVRAFANVMAAGNSGTPFNKEVVNNSWDISESVAGGSDLSITTTWNATDELPGFDRTRGGLSKYITSPAENVGWDLLNSQTGAATGANPYQYTRTGISSLGIFAVGTRPVLSPLLVTPKIFLQGAYNTVTGLMSDNLRTLNLIPLTEPYSALPGFITTPLRGSGGGETSASSVIGSAAGVSTNSSIVDWVLAQLHDGTTGAVISQRAVLLKRDGSIVETDGVSPLNFAGNATGNYFVSIRHRNHLGIRSLNAFPLTKVTTSPYDFTSSLSQVFAGAVPNSAMSTLGADAFGMWGANANDDITVKMTGFTATTNDYLRLLNILGSNTASQIGVYAKEDLNMDGTIKMTGFTAATNDYLRLLNVLGSNTASLSQPVF